MIVADDGLQHLQLARDMEIAVVNYRGLGNGWMLPAGPLREPRSRLDRVDAIVLNGIAAEVPEIASGGAALSHADARDQRIRAARPEASYRVVSRSPPNSAHMVGA